MKLQTKRAVLLSIALGTSNRQIDPIDAKQCCVERTASVYTLDLVWDVRILLAMCLPPKPANYRVQDAAAEHSQMRNHATSTPCVSGHLVHQPCHSDVDVQESRRMSARSLVAVC